MALPPEAAHALAVGMMPVVFPGPAPPVTDAALKSRVFGLDFPNPVGLAAGFDKDAKIPQFMFRAGFGFVEAGTLTPEPQEGNPRPRIFRLREDRALINRLGFNNEGFARALTRLEKLSPRDRTGVLGVNIGANKTAKDPLADYERGIKTFGKAADYLTVNISSPNTPGLRDIQKKKNLERLLARLAAVRTKTPLLVKIAPDLTDAELKGVVDLALKYRVDGLVISNTTVARPETLKGRYKAESGGLSGRPLFEPSTKMLAKAYRLSKGKLPLIGVGGVAGAKQAYEKILAGASLVQLYTGFIYEGPGLAKRINNELIPLLEKDGYTNVSQAVGKGVKS